MWQCLCTYGGTAIAWKKEIDHLIDDNIEDGNEHIICIRIKAKPKPILQYRKNSTLFDFKGSF
jgi:hypothetical protein